jgi:hypothetical protein
MKIYNILTYMTEKEVNNQNKKSDNSLLLYIVENSKTYNIYKNDKLENLKKIYLNKNTKYIYIGLVILLSIILFYLIPILIEKISLYIKN